jgi:hypothetical protein
MATGFDGGELLISTGVSAALESGKSLTFYARETFNHGKSRE